MVWTIPYPNIRADTADILTREIDTKLFTVEFAGFSDVRFRRSRIYSSNKVVANIIFNHNAGERFEIFVTFLFW